MKTSLHMSRARTSILASTTQDLMAWNSNFGATVDNTYIIRTAGVFSNLYVRMVTNDRAASTFKFRKNGADANLSISTSTTGEFEDNSNTDTVTSGDKINLRLVTGSGGTTFIPTTSRLVFTASSGETVNLVGGSDNDNVSTASTYFYFPLGGRIAGGGSTTESQALMNIKIPGTFRNFGYIVLTNTRTTTSTVGIRLNGADSSLKQTVTAAATGYFEDTSNTVSVTYEDTTCMYMLTGTGAGNLRLRGFIMEYVTPSPHFQIFAGQATGGSTFAVSTTNYVSVGGALTQGFTTESEMQIKMPFAATLSNLQVRVPTNTVTNADTFRLRVNSANVNQSASITGSTTGLFQDTSLVGDYVLTGDEISYQFVTGTAGTSTIVNGASVLAALPQTRGF